MTSASGLEPRYVGIDLSGPVLRAALVDQNGQVEERREAKTEADQILNQVAQVVANLRGNSPRIEAVGIAIPGLVNRNTDRVVVSRDLPSTVREDMHAEFMKASGARVEIENDANAAAYGEYKVGAGRGSRDMFYITIGEGIGGAIILDGKLWTGASGFAGEFGHITIDAEGIECECGNTGCLETLRSEEHTSELQSQSNLVCRLLLDEQKQ